MSSSKPLTTEEPWATPSHNPMTVLVVDDQDSARAVLASALDRMGHRVIEAHEAEWAMQLFQKHRPDLVLLDVAMPGHDGFWLTRQLRDIEPGSWTPIIFLSNQARDTDIWRGIEAGGDDYLVKPASPLVLMSKLRAMQRLIEMRRRLVEMSEELREANEHLHGLTEIDPLTGLYNRRGFSRHFHRALAIARRDQSPLTLVLFDIDHFKALNDNRGHAQGDACLEQISAILKVACHRSGDCAARYGGDEFALILPDTPKSGAMTFVRAMVHLLDKRAVPNPGSAVASHVTLSGGFTTCVPDATTTVEGMLLRADEALYAAKARGRNRFFSFELQVDSLKKS